MVHKIAKLLLEHSDTFLERTEAVKTALSLGMPLNQVEEYLDWLELVKGREHKHPRGQPHPHSPQPRKER